MKVFGDGHPDIAMVYCNIGWIYNLQSDYKNALKNIYKAIKILEQIQMRL